MDKAPNPIKKTAISSLLALALIAGTGTLINVGAEKFFELATRDNGIILPSWSAQYMNPLQIILIEGQKQGVVDCAFSGNKIYRGGASSDSNVRFKCYR